MSVKHATHVLGIVNNDLSAIEERFKTFRNDISMLQSQKYTCERSLYHLNNQIAKTSRFLNSFRISCERQRREIEYLSNEKARLEALVTEFKNNNEDYLEIEQTGEEKVKDVLRNSRLLLQFAIASIIESIRINPEIYDFVLSDDIYAALILEEAEKLYNKLTTDLTNRVMAAVASARTIRASS